MDEWSCPNCGDSWAQPYQDDVGSSTCDNCSEVNPHDALDILVDIWENPDASIPWDRIQKLLEDINYETLND